jgi:hypothetical protein
MFQQRSTEERILVAVDEREVRVLRPNGEEECVTWDDLLSVEVHTTDCGPFTEDVFYVLTGAAGGCVVPQSAQGADALVDKVACLPGFDYEQWTKAMSSTANARFLCWQRGSA